MGHGSLQGVQWSVDQVVQCQPLLQDSGPSSGMNAYNDIETTLYDFKDS